MMMHEKVQHHSSRIGIYSTLVITTIMGDNQLVLRVDSLDSVVNGLVAVIAISEVDLAFA